MKRFAIIGLIFLTLIISLSAGCTEVNYTSDEELFQKISVTSEEMIIYFDDIDAQTKDSESIKSLEKLISFTNKEIDTVNKMSFDDPDLEKIRDDFAASLWYSQVYATHTISYIESGDLNDLKDATRNEKLSNQIMGDILKSYIDYTRLHYPGSLPENQFEKNDLIQSTDSKTIYFVNYYDEIADSYHMYYALNLSWESASYSKWEFWYYTAADDIIDREEIENEFRLLLSAEDISKKNMTITKKN